MFLMGSFIVFNNVLKTSAQNIIETLSNDHFISEMFFFCWTLFYVTIGLENIQL